MFSLDSISVFQFKNYLQQSWTFPERVIGITGRNGTGKTNLLDAIYFLCFTKSYFQRTDSALVHHGALGMRVAGQFRRQGMDYEVSGIIRETGRKEFMVNGEVCEKMADHIGRFPSVMIAPDDVQIITDGSEERRRFMDALFSQLDHVYLLQLMTYNRVLQQRNSLLKQMAETRRRQLDLLDILDQQLVGPAAYIFNRRQEYLGHLLRMVSGRYYSIAGQQYDLLLKYESPLLAGQMEALLAMNRERDLAAQRTLAGIHRDDIGITLGEKPFRQSASQGQRKSLLFALKLAEFAMLKETKGFAPILLLDDVFEKLDEGRMQNLLQEVCVHNDGQVFVTDTHPQRLENSFKALGLPFQAVSSGH